MVFAPVTCVFNKGSHMKIDLFINEIFDFAKIVHENWCLSIKVRRFNWMTFLKPTSYEIVKNDKNT